jgi:hypothetical protein
MNRRKRKINDMVNFMGLYRRRGGEREKTVALY